MDRKYLQVLRFRRYDNNEICTGKYHFKTSESAIKNSMKMIEQKPNLVSAQVISKETNEVAWSWEA